MKSISASIIALSGAVLYATGATIQHNQTHVACLIWAAIGLFGFWAWATSFFGKSE